MFLENRKSVFKLCALIAISSLLYGCESAVLIMGFATAPARTEIANRERQVLDSYLDDVFEKDRPIITRTINHKAESGGYGACLLDIAIRRKRFDIVRKALIAGARPSKCETGSSTFRIALVQSEPKDLPQLAGLLNDYKALTGFNKSLIIYSAVMSNSPALIDFGVLVGADVNNPIDIYQFPSYKRDPLFQTPLYIAVREFKPRQNSTLKIIEKLFEYGAKYDDSIEIVLSKKKSSNDKDPTWQELNDILHSAKNKV